ncbi:MAG: hypothetical protein JXA57_13430, partial [Armatimonadetes bacterium]|nr:hypothetical protein [Armatimonadota bacterium]
TFLLGIAVALLGCYVATHIWLMPGSSAGSAPQAVRATTPARPGQAQIAVKPLAEGYEDLVVTVTVPAESDPLAEATSGHGPACPQTKVSAILGMRIESPHGIICGIPKPAGPAGTAGIRRGDSIIMAAGEVVTCPVSLLPHIKPGPERRDIELTVRRSQTSSESAAASESVESEPAAPE